METKFIKGMHVYDAIFNPKETLTVQSVDSFNVTVIDEYGFKEYYDFEGFRLIEDNYGYLMTVTNVPTLSTEHYTLQGFK